jgi:hypothetical protein
MSIVGVCSLAHMKMDFVVCEHAEPVQNFNFIYSNQRDLKIRHVTFPTEIVKTQGTVQRNLVARLGNKRDRWPLK